MPDRYAILDAAGRTSPDTAAILATLPSAPRGELLHYMRDNWPGCVLVDLENWAIILGEEETRHAGHHCRRS